MAKFEKKIHAEGHLIDSDLLSKAMSRVIREGGTFRILEFRVGGTNEEPSRIHMEVRAGSGPELSSILQGLSDLGFASEEIALAQFQPAPVDGVAPGDFYSTTNHRTEVYFDGGWHAVEDQRMDACIVRKPSGSAAFCRKLRDVRAGDAVLVGLTGVRVLPEFAPRDRSDFSFMGSDVSSERQVKLAVRHVAQIIRETKARAEKVVWVPGPVIIHTGAGDDFTALISAGYVDAVLSGNALAVHDIEFALFGTSLGVSLKDGQVIHLGHRHHMRAINAIRDAGSIRDAVERGILSRGIFHQLVIRNVPFVLAGSIRDDGPLPDTLMDLIKAQDAYAAILKDAGLVIVLSTMLHGIGVGNMLKSSVPLVCVDIHPAVATKLSDRGSAQSYPIVTDVGLFLHRLKAELCGE